MRLGKSAVPQLVKKRTVAFVFPPFLAKDSHERLFLVERWRVIEDVQVLVLVETVIGVGPPVVVRQVLSQLTISFKHVEDSEFVLL